MKTLPLILSIFIILLIWCPLADSQGSSAVRASAPSAPDLTSAPSGGATYGVAASAVSFYVQPSTTSPGAEVSLYLSQPAQPVVVYFNGRALPKKTSPDGTVIVVPVPGDAQSGSWYFELQYNGQMIQSQNMVTVTPSASTSTSSNPNHHYSGTPTNVPSGIDRTPPAPTPAPYAGNAQSVDWNNIPGLVLHLFHNGNQANPMIDSTKTNLYFFGAYDLGAPAGIGYCWWMVPDNPNANPADWFGKLPPGLVLGLKHYPIQKLDIQISVFGNNPIYDANLWHELGDENIRYWIKGLSLEIGGDEGAKSDEGFVWYETTNYKESGPYVGFTNWEEAEENLPKGTVLCLKHSYPDHHQNDKTVTWRGITYDPEKSYKDGAASPPTFIARYGGDLGASSGEGFFWFEKTTGPDFFQPTTNPPGGLHLLGGA